MRATLRRPAPRTEARAMASTSGKRHVVIVGGGFAGLGCAQRLADHEDVTVTLIDRNNHHQFQPLLYQVATSQLAPSDIAHSLRAVFAGKENVDVKLADIADGRPGGEDGDGERRRGVGSADALVLAAGSQPNFFGTPGAPEHSFPLYSLDDATRLRSRILGLFEQVDRDPTLVQRGALNFVIVGGGPTGVEVAGAIADMLAVTVPAEYRGLDAVGGPHLPARLRRRAAEAVLRQGARLRRQGADRQGRRDPPRHRRQGGRPAATPLLSDGAIVADPLRRLGRRHQGRAGCRRLRPRPGPRRAHRRLPGPHARRQRRRVRDRRRRQHSRPGRRPAPAARLGRAAERHVGGGQHPRRLRRASPASRSPTTTRGSWR